jgi:hypothetical protein
MPVIEIRVDREPSVQCLRKLIAMIEELIRELEAGGPEPVTLRDAVMMGWVRASSQKMDMEVPCDKWVCEDCHPGSFELPTDRSELIGRLAHFFAVLDEHTPRPL